MQTLSNLSPFLDNLRYFMVAAIGSAFYSLTIFRYRSSSTFYDEAKIGTGINWWQLSDWIRLYGGLGISGLLALTQLFATLGVLVGLNCYIWIIVGGFGGVTLFATISVMRFLGWEAGYKASTDTSSPSAQKTRFTHGTENSKSHVEQQDKNHNDTIPQRGTTPPM